MKIRIVEEIKLRQELDKQRAVRLNNWSQGISAGPFKVIYFPTNRCNLKCNICWQRQGVHDYSELSVPRQMKLVDEAFQLGVKEFVIGGGGEPLLKWNIIQPLLKKIKEYKMYGLLFTNGTLITPEIASFLVEIKWDKVLISLDGTENINDQVRGEGSYHKIINGLDYILKARNNESKPIIGIGFALTRQGMSDIPNVMRILGEKDGDQLNLIRLVVYSSSQRKFALNKEDLQSLTKIMEDALIIADNYGIVTNLKDYLDSEFIKNSENFNKILLSNKTEQIEMPSFWNALCFEPFTNIVIHSDGNVGPCCMSGNTKIASLENHTLGEIWSGDEFEKLREGIKNRKLESYCNICDINVFQDNQHLREEGSRL
ncbi:MAG: radical SAM protein [Bacilli bacterium]|nr:radical SAM protein [Bacilli bacterium]